MKNSFQKVLIRLVLILVIAAVWVLYLRGWNIGNFESFVDAVVSRLIYVFAGVGLIAVLFARTKHI